MLRTLLILIFFVGSLKAQIDFGKYFTEGALRFDYYHIGNAKNESIIFDKFIKEPFWSGSRVNLIDTFQYGAYFIKVRQPNSGKTLYSRGYSTLFREWQTTDEAKKITKAFQESVTFPFPKDSVVLEIYSRGGEGEFEKIFRMGINPKNYFIERLKPDGTVIKEYYSGMPSKRLDIALLAEGYTASQFGEFKSDCKRFTNYLFQYSPFDSSKNKINVWGVFTPSSESGADIPADSIWKKTALNSSYYTFNSERYLMTEDYFKVRDLAASVPYDAICILVNSSKYGGGGIYNYYAIVAAKNKKAKQIFIHEFGHSFGGLADEYYTSSVSYKNFYPKGIEPWEPNITTLVNFSKKWKDMIEKGTPIPTPPEDKYANVIGVFEGGGYVAKGVYRPSLNSLMRSFTSNEFNAVSKRALRRMIDFYIK